MPRFLYFTSIVNYRVPLNDDGTCGNPEVMKKFTMESKNKSSSSPYKKKAEKTLQTQTIEDYTMD
jgi:hypothetical protein